MNKTQSYFCLCILLVFYLTGCVHKEELGYKKIKSISVELSFVPERLSFFYYKDSLYFYTYNYSTNKNLEIYNNNGALHCRIDLSQLKRNTDKINIKMHTLDSIYILSTKPYYLHLLNRNGVVTKTVKLDSLVYCKTKYNQKRCKYLDFFFYGDILVKNKDILVGLSIIDTFYKESQDVYQNRLSANMQKRNNPNLALMRDVLDSNCTIIFEPIWIGRTIKEEYHDFNVEPYYLYMKNKIIFFISHDRHIYFANPSDLTFEQKIPIYSEYAVLEYEKPKITQQNQKTYKKPYIFYAMYKSAILDVYLADNKYFVLIKHEVPLPEKEEMITLPDRYNVSYSVILYDKEWNKQKEMLLPAQEKFISFLPNGQFVTQSKSKNPRNITLNFYQWTE